MTGYRVVITQRPFLRCMSQESTTALCLISASIQHFHLDLSSASFDELRQRDNVGTILDLRVWRVLVGAKHRF
jgi:hypothetical protein